MAAKTLIAIATTIFVYWGVLASCVVVGCYSHETASYAVVASLGVITIAFVLAVAFVSASVDSCLVAYLCFFLVVLGSLFGGFSGYTWDNYCVFRETPIQNATAETLRTHSRHKIFHFKPNVFLLSSMTEHYNKDSNNWFAAPIVECPNNTSPDLGTCPAIGSRTETIAYAVKYDYTLPYESSSPNWNLQTKQGAKLKFLFSPYLGSLFRRVRNMHSDRLDFPPNLPYLTWGDLTKVEETCKINAVGTLAGGAMAPLFALMFGLVLFRHSFRKYICGCLE